MAYKPNVVYVCEIDQLDYYVGCHCHNRGLRDCTLLQTSGNPLNVARQKGQLSLDEYKKRCKVISIEEYDTPEEAKNREAELIEKFKNHYGDRCLNQSKGNKYGQSGLTCSEETRKKISDSLKGKPLSEETRKKMSESKGVFGVRQYDLNGNFIAEYPSTREAERQTGISQSRIVQCCKGRCKSAGKSVWKYA